MQKCFCILHWILVYIQSSFLKYSYSPYNERSLNAEPHIYLFMYIMQRLRTSSLKFYIMCSNGLLKKLNSNCSNTDLLLCVFLCVCSNLLLNRSTSRVSNAIHSHSTLFGIFILFFTPSISLMERGHLYRYVERVYSHKPLVSHFSRVVSMEGVFIWLSFPSPLY